MHWLLFIHKILISSTCFEPQCSSSGGCSCTHAAYSTVTLYESSWWPVGTQLEWELSFGLQIRDAVTRPRRPRLGWDYRTIVIFSRDFVLPSCRRGNCTATKLESQDLTTMKTYTAYCAAWLVVKTDHSNVCVEFEIFIVKTMKNTVFLVWHRVDW